MKRVLLLAVVLLYGSYIFAQNHFQPETSQFENNTMIIGVVSINDVEQRSLTLEVGTFCGTQCRASTMAMYENDFDRYIFYIDAYGVSGNTFTFKLYDHEEGKELDYLICNTEVQFNSDEPVGFPWDPTIISFTGEEPLPVHQLTIEGYGTTDGNYYLIAPPFDNINPAQVEGMTSGDFDLFYFDQAESLEWRNYGTTPFNLESGKGYLYAHKTTVTLSFTGVPYSGDGKVTLRKTGGLDFEGWNLVGNPFATPATLDREFYVMNTAGTEIIVATGTGVAAMQGIFVIANSDNEQIQFTQSGSGSKEQIVLNVLQDRGNTIDRAIVRFNENSTLPKFMLNDSNTKLYIPQEDDDYAVVNSNGANSMPVNFKAMANGTYTLSVDINLDMEYLHLIDNKTGADIDLLVQPDYQFAADKNDNEARFMLVFRSTTGVEENGQQNFCFVKGSNLYFNEDVQNAELSLVDITGRLVRQMTLKGNSCDLSGISEGLYIVRLAKDNEVKVQKVVIR